MRVLSEISGEEVFDVIADIIDPLSNIAEDGQVMAYFTKEEKPKDVSTAAFVIGKLRKCLPKLLKDHRGDIVAVMAAIEGVTPDEYVSNMTIATLLGHVMAVLSDNEFLAFLSSAKAERQTDEGGFTTA